jgi:ribosomal protein L7/L12
MSFTRYVEIFGSFDYQVPEDKEQQLYDFYMLSLLYGQSSFQRNVVDRPATDIPAPTKVGTFNNEDKIDYMLEEVAKRLLPQLKHNLLDAVFFAICAELRHIYDFLDVETLHKLLGLLNGRQKDAFTKYNKNYLLIKDMSYRTINPQRVPKVRDKEYADSSTTYRNSYKAFLKSGADRHTFVELADILFLNGQWASSYGGKAWADIAKGWLSLDRAKTFPQMMVQIDHVYDLQHNTDTVFNKLQSYLKNNSFSWIADALDHKAKIKSPYEIMDKVSGPMKQLAQRAIWTKMGISQEAFRKEQEKYQQQKEKEQKEKLSSYNYDVDDDNFYYGKEKEKSFGYDDWELAENGMKRYHKQTGEIQHSWSGDWISEDEYKYKKQNLIDQIDKNITQNIQWQLFHASNPYRAVCRALGYGYNKHFDPFYLINYYAEKQDWLNRPEEFKATLLGFLNPNFNNLITCEIAVQTYALKKATKESGQSAINKLNQEINKELEMINYFDVRWKFSDVVDFLNGKEGSDVMTAAKQQVVAASHFDLGLTKAVIDQLIRIFHSNPKSNKIAVIKELRQATSWPLKSSKSIAEYLMVYDLLTNPSSRRLMQKIKYGT